MRMMKSLQREQAERELKLQQDNFNAQVELQAQQFKQQMKVPHLSSLSLSLCL